MFSKFIKRRRLKKLEKHGWTYDKVELVAQHLRKLGAGEIEPLNRDGGMCHDVYRVLDDFTIYVYFLYESFIDEFEYYSGSVIFPVSSDTYSDGMYAFLCHRDKWDGDYGDRRRAFCTFVASELEKRYL